MGRLTYIIYLDGAYRAVGMSPLADCVFSLETPASRDGIRTVSDRNDAIRALSRPLTWRDALTLARASGRYIGQLYAGEHHVMEAC